MVDLKREGLGLLWKFVRSALKNEDTNTETLEQTEEPEASASVNQQAEPMQLYWEKDKQELGNNQHFIDLFLNKVALERIPDATEKPVKESQYSYETISLNRLPDTLKHLNFEAVTETPKTGTGISNSTRDAGMVAGVVVAVISGVIILAALIAVVMYRHYVHRNVTSMNFDNPVYRKTTEDQFALEKNGYAPGSKLYPSTVGEEAQEPLNTPGTNDFV